MTVKTSKNPQENATIHPELVGIMREIYSKYTGYEVAAAIAVIRKELNADEEIERRKQMLAELGIKE